MTPSHVQKARRTARFASRFLIFSALLALVCGAHAQNPDHPIPPEPGQVRTFFLKNVTQVNDLNDIQTALRNALPHARLYGIYDQNAITIRATAEELDTAQKLIAELDRPRPVYRVTYTIADLESGKRVSEHSISVLVPAYGKGVLKQGTRVPIMTGSAGTGSDVTTQFQYIDVGLNLDAAAMGAQLHTKIEESAVAEDKSIGGVQEPVIRQTMLEGVSPLAGGKPVVLGTIDVPNSTRQHQISVSAEPLSGSRE